MDIGHATVCVLAFIGVWEPPPPVLARAQFVLNDIEPNAAVINCWRLLATAFMDRNDKGPTADCYKWSSASM